MSRLVDFLGLKILRGETLEEIKASTNLLKGVDLVEIFSQADSRQKFLQSKKYLGGRAGFWRPRKVVWRMKIGSEPIISQIRSKRARKQIRGDEKKLKAKGIEIKTFSHLDQSLFEEWRNLYGRKIDSKKKGRILVGQNWLSKREKKGKKLGAALAFQEGKIIGGNLFYQIRKTLSVAYGITERIPGLAGGLGLLLDYYSMVYAQALGCQAISLGQDTNLYGFHLSPGLLFYKVKLGFKPVPATKTGWATTYFLNFERFGEEVMFFGDGKEGLSLYIITEKTLAESAYLPLGVGECQVFDKETVLVKHRNLFRAC